MHQFRWLAVPLILGASALAGAGQGEPKPQHGGTVSSTDAYQFEVVFERSGVKVYALTKDGKPVDTSGLSGTATFYHPNSPKPWFSRDLVPGRAAAGQRPGSLELTIGLGAVPETGAKAEFKITGLADSAEFATPVRFTAPPRPVVPPTLAFVVATKADARAIAAQRVCKVSGESLGSMGTPIKATRGASSTFLCCRGCMSKVQADPDRFLGPAK